MKFVNRTEERDYMRRIINDITGRKEMCVWIEGSRGTGKSYFMKYMKETSKLPLLYWGNHNWTYKCNESGIDSEYQFFIEIISVFQLKYPQKFNDFLTKYFHDIYDISWIETLAYILPNIKVTEWAKDLINKPLEQIENAKNEITNRLYNPGLRTCLAELVLYFLIDVQKEKNIVFCIDDACWLDEHSIQTLKILLNKAKYEKNEILKISVIILTRPVDELNSSKENYHSLESSLKDVYEEIAYIRIKNFDYKATQEYIKIMDKKYVSEITHNIFRITGGNPQELFQALKFNDWDLKEIIQVETQITNNNFVSSELIIKLTTDNSYVLPIICATSLIQQKMKLSWLPIFTKNFCKQVLDESFNTIKYENCIKRLCALNIIEINMDTIDVMHDSLKETAIDYIKNSGEYVDYLSCLTDTISKEFILNSVFVKELMHLYSKFNPIKCFELFTEYYCEHMHLLDGNIIKLVAQLLAQESTLYTQKNISKYIVPIIMDRCIQLSYYELGYAIGSIIYYKQDVLSLNIRYKYLIYFAKILIDKGFLRNNKKFNAIDVIEYITSLPQLSSDQKIESYIIAMSAYEHVLDFEKINKYNILAKQLIDNESVSALYHAMYLRNQGLVKSHCVLEQHYIQAIEYSKKIEKEYERNLMLGTCYNNLGLHYLYTANIENALLHFNKSKKYLDEIGYDIFRILNNIAICYMLIGKNEEAYNYLLNAKWMNTNCVFEKLCIQSNISILEYKQGNFEVAKKIITNIIDDYEKEEKQTADDLVYSSAMVNMAYFYFAERNYTSSADLYKKSKFFNYRYNDDLQKKKRQDMINLCLFHLGFGDKQLHDIDVEDKSSNIFQKMYAPIAFAYYII